MFKFNAYISNLESVKHDDALIMCQHTKYFKKSIIMKINFNLSFIVMTINHPYRKNKPTWKNKKESILYYYYTILKLTMN